MSLYILFLITGAGRVTFSSRVSFMSAVSCRFFQVTYGDIDKKVIITFNNMHICNLVLVISVCKNDHTDDMCSYSYTCSCLVAIIVISVIFLNKLHILIGLAVVVVIKTLNALFLTYSFTTYSVFFSFRLKSSHMF